MGKARRRRRGRRRLGRRRGSTAGRCPRDARGRRPGGAGRAKRPTVRPRPPGHRSRSPGRRRCIGSRSCGRGDAPARRRGGSRGALLRGWRRRRCPGGSARCLSPPPRSTLEAANDVGAGRARADAPTRAEPAEIDAGLGEGVLHGGDGGEAANLTRLTRLGADVETKMRYAAADATGGSTGASPRAPRARGRYRACVRHLRIAAPGTRAVDAHRSSAAASRASISTSPPRPPLASTAE